MSFVSEYVQLLKNLKPELDEAEKVRKSYLKKFVIGESIVLIFCIVYIILFANYVSNILLPAVTILAFFPALSYFPCRNFINYKKYLKTNLVPKLIKCFGDIERVDEWNIKSFFDKNELDTSNLFSSFDRMITDDAFYGSYQGIKYKIAEMHLIQGSGKHASTAFKGVVIAFPSNKTINSNTVIATKKDMNIRNYPTGIISTILTIPFLAFIWYWGITSGELMKDPEGLIKIVLGTIAVPVIIYGFFKKFKSMEAVKLEDVNFDKRFNVFGTDQVEARYLITPAFIERFLRLNTAFGTKKAKCSFYKNQNGDDTIMFAISTNKDLFETGNLLTPINEPKYYFLSDFISIFDMIEFFKLNEQTKI